MIHLFQMEIYFVILTLVVTTIAAYTDIKSRTIPNCLSFIGIPIALIFIFLGRDSFNTQSYLLSGVLSLILMVPCFYAKVFGGGDAKLLILLGFCIPIESFVWLWFYISIVGGVEALFFLAYKKKLKQKIPYAVAIWLGTILFWFDSFS